MVFSSTFARKNRSSVACSGPHASGSREPKHITPSGEPDDTNASSPNPVPLPRLLELVLTPDLEARTRMTEVAQAIARGVPALAEEARAWAQGERESGAPHLAWGGRDETIAADRGHNCLQAGLVK